jgi:plastocyanin
MNGTESRGSAGVFEMTMQQKKGWGGVMVAVCAGAVLVAGAVAARTAHDAVRVELVIEQMTFRGRDAASPDRVLDNPAITVRAGQTIEVVLSSLDQGMKHDLVFPDLKLATASIGYGERATLRFTAPRPGTYTYWCSMHPQIMVGELIVTE